MTRDDKPTCPKCGSSDLQLLAEHQDDPGSFLGAATPERAITRVYKCSCGMAFTEREEGDRAI
jgi:hypothetical protein